MPGAALLEATLAAAWALNGDRSLAMLSLQGAAIPAPLLLPRQPGSAGTPAQICMSAQGACSLESASQQGSWTTHLTCQATRAGASPVAAARAKQAPGLAWLSAVLCAVQAGRGSAGPVASIAAVGERTGSWRCHPAVIDSSMHLSLYARPADGRTRVPGELQPALCFI